MTIGTAANGLQHEDVVVGDGVQAMADRYITVYYTGWFYKNGQADKKFDSNRDHSGPFAFHLSGGMAIEGWDEGVQGMEVSGARKLIIPAALGYGACCAGDVISLNATLPFEADLLEV